MHQSTRRRIVSVALLGLACGGPAVAQEFALQVGPPIAVVAQTGSVVQKASKLVLFVVRPTGCPDAASARITGVAEGVAGGVRRSVDLELDPLPTPGVHAVPRGWAEEGTWVVRLTGTCGERTAGAIVSLGPRDVYQRDAVQTIAAAPTAAQVDAALQAAARRTGPAR